MNSKRASYAEALSERIRNKTVRVGVIGLGYVGLPLCVEFAKAGAQVTGIDIDENKISRINSGQSYIQDVSQDLLLDLSKAKRLTATADFSVIAQLDTINICVPTPLRKSKDPDISYIVAATQEIVKYLHPGMLNVLESTTYPGTTEEVILPMLEESGLKVGEDLFLAFSPERVDPGNPTFNTHNIPKVVGGVTEACTELAKEFYSLAIEKVFSVSSPRSAEMVQLLENTFRSVNIGLVNEICQMSSYLGVDIWEVIDAASTKPFGFMPFYPGPGLGGHCIPIDPHYLAWKARMSGFSPRFIDLADNVNSAMPEFVMRRAQSILNQQAKPLRGTRIHLLGVTYKKNVSDVRESPALLILEALEREGAVISYSDPYVPELALPHRTYRSLDVTKENIPADLAILVTNHDWFDYKQLTEKFSLILDTRNAFKKLKAPNVVAL